MTAMATLTSHGSEVSQVIDFAHGIQASLQATGHFSDIFRAAAPHTEP
jgi:hypothetical protein